MKPNMKAPHIVFRLWLLIDLGIAMPGLPTTAQTTLPNEGQLSAPEFRKLTGADVKRAEDLDKAVATARES